MGHYLLLGEDGGLLEVVDISSYTITSAHEFREVGRIHDMLAIDDTHCLLAAYGGLLKTTKDQLINHYY